MLKKALILLVFIGIIYQSLVFAALPDHDRQLYFHDLRDNDPEPLGQLSNGNGTFTTNGWKASSAGAQLRIDLRHFLPFEGTVQFTATGLLPKVTDDWVMFAMYSRGEGAFEPVNESPGSYVMLKTDPALQQEYNYDFKFITASFHGDGSDSETKKRDTRIPKRSWNSNAEYVFKIVWNTESLWLFINGEQVAVHHFVKQMEGFGYIFFGRDNTYGATMIGPTFKDLSIKGPATNYPFTNITNAYSEMSHTKLGAQGVSISDVDLNKDEDLYISRFFNAGYSTENFLYMQTSEQFVEEGSTRNVNDPSYSYQSLVGDFDGDSDNDIFVVNFHSPPNYANNPNHLYRNDNGQFSDVTSSHLTGNTAADSKGATMSDIENDGDLDIIVSNSTKSHQVYVNDGTGHFNVETRGLENFRQATKKYQSVVSGDINNDGYQDLVLVHQEGLHIIRNNGSGNFAQSTDLNVPATANSASLCDIDGDGDLDILVAVSSDNARVEIFKNNGDNSFSNISDVQQINLSTFGVTPGDWDNDGDIDLFGIDKTTTGRLYINDGFGRFAFQAGTGVESQYADGRGSATFDVNNDGRLDIYTVARGSIEAEKNKPYSRNYLYRNDIPTNNNYLKVKIVDENDNIGGFGSKISVYKSGSLGVKTELIAYREILSSNGFVSQSSPIEHMGVGGASTVDVQVVLPDGTEKSFKNIATNQTLVISPSQIVAAKLINKTAAFIDPVAGSKVIAQCQVLTEDDNPVSNYSVLFEILSGDGSLSNGQNVISKTVTTDASGMAQVEWTLGPVAGLFGTNELKASSTNLEGFPLLGSPITWSAITVPGNPTKIEQISGNDQLGFIGVRLENDLVSRVTDDFGNGISQHQVEYKIISGGGSLSGSAQGSQITVNTDSDGYARAKWDLGPVIGQQVANAAAQFQGVQLVNSPLTFIATAQVPQRKLLYVSGDRQWAPINQELAAPLVVQLLNSDDTPVVEEEIKFIAESFDSHFSGADTLTVYTNNQGIASATPTLGTSIGDTIYVFKAYAFNALGSPVEFKASATSGPPTFLQEISGNEQTGPAGRVLPLPIKVQVLDVNKYPVSKYKVQFNITEGGGTINGATTIEIETDGQGYATAAWKIGEKIGANSCVVTAGNLTGSPIIFTAQGIVGPPARLTKIRGDNQSGNAGQKLAQPFIVSITDSFYNVISMFPITFTVTMGGGNINGQTQVVQNTNVFGQAQVILTLGSSEYEHQVTVTSEYQGYNLIGSPMIFTAYLGPGDPHKLIEVSGNNQIGRVDSELKEPFKVRVEDENGISISNAEVEFFAFTPGAHFYGSTNFKTRTNPEGIAQAVATLGSNYGVSNNVFEVVAKYNDKNLINSPIQFFASGRKSDARKMAKMDENQTYTGVVGLVLADSIKVLVTNENDVPVNDHPVLFEITEGLALINGIHSTFTVNTNKQGIAAISILLGTKPGSSVVRAVSDDGVAPLTPGSLQFNIIAMTGAPDPKSSQISAQSGLVANGQDESDVEITLRDKYNNPITGQLVRLQTAGIDVFVTQPEDLTDDSGKTNGSISSLNVGKVTVWAMVNDQPIVSIILEFVTGPAALAIPFGSNQYQEKEKVLRDPVGVQVLDEWQHPIEGVEVLFSIVDGGGSIDGPQPKYSDSEGKASVVWTLGPKLGEQRIKAKISGISGEIFFTAHALPPSQGIVKIVSGDSLIGLVNRSMPQAFTISVADLQGNSIQDISVEFRLTLGLGPGQGTFQTPNPVKSDANGQASAIFRTGSITGLHQVTATAGNYGTVVFNFIVQNERTITLTKLTQDGQTVRPRTEMPISIKAIDAFSRVLANESINLNITQGQGYIKETMPFLTNEDGIAGGTWVVGVAGAQQVEVKPLNASSNTLFYTAVVVNSPPAFNPPLPRNLSTEAGLTVLISVKAEDPDGDNIYYIIRNKPENAVFDSEGTRLFTWQPSVQQVGDHTMTFVAMDEYGAADSSQVKISVGLRNECPKIESINPAEKNITITFGTPVTFEIQASDENGDVLTYKWTVNNAFAGDTYLLPVVFTKQEFPDSFATVDVVVSDGICDTQNSWQVNLRTGTFVELEHFEVKASGNKVEIVWQTSREKGTAGFFVLRSDKEDGIYQSINQQIIKPEKAKSYTYVDQDVQAGKKYFYKLREVDIYGIISDFGLVEVEIELPTRIALAQNYPNPFNPATTIRFELPQTILVKIMIYNTMGQVVTTLVDGPYMAGIHNIIWDATDDTGRKVTSGIYYYRMTTENFTQTRKLLLLK